MSTLTLKRNITCCAVVKFCVILTMVICFYNPSNVFSQSVSPFIINVTGGNYVNRGSFTQNNFSLVWSVGEAAITETFTTTNGAVILTQGVLQHFTEFDLQTSPVLHWTKEEVKMYPIPVNNTLQIDVFSRDTGIVNMQLYDVLGRTLKISQFLYNTLPIHELFDFSTYPSGNYLLKLSLFSKGALKKNTVFKIIKIRS